MSRILTRSQLAKIQKARLTLGAFGSKGYFEPSDLLGSYPKPFVREAGTVGLWNFFDDDIIDSTVLDQSVNGNNGTISGAVLSSESKFRESLYFDGTSDYVNVPDNASLDLLKDITIEIWFNRKSSPPDVSVDLIQKAPSGSGGYVLYITGSQQLVFLKQGDGTSSTPATTIMGYDQWYYGVGTKEGSLASCYLNGKLEDTDSSFSDFANVGDLRIGMGNDGYFNGYIAGVRITNRAKTANEIHDYYHGLKGY